MKNRLVNSGAGTGKTTYMQNSIREYLLQEGTKEEDILGITFTNRAGHHMKKGLHEFPKVEISSLHKYFYNKVEHREIIPEDILGELMIDTSSKINKRLYSINRKIKTSELHNFLNSWYTFNVIEVLNLDKDYKNYNSLREMIRTSRNIGNYAKVKSRGSQVDTKFYYIVLEELTKMVDFMYGLGYVTFNDIILQGIFYTNHNIKYVLIDEFQDLTYIEFVSIVTISKNAKFLVLCDEFQGIYQWRNSNSIYNLRKLFTHCNL